MRNFNADRTEQPAAERPKRKRRALRAMEAPKTLPDFRLPDQPDSAASGELVGRPVREEPEEPIGLAVVLGRALVQRPRLRKGVITIGRDAQQDICIDDGSVSRKHCQIRHHRGEYLLYDLGTANGTTLNGRSAVYERLYPGDEIGVGRFVIIFEPNRPQLDKLEYGVESPALMDRPDNETAFLSIDEIEYVRRTVAAERQAHLMVIGGRAKAGRRFTLGKDTGVLGRAAKADVPLVGWFVSKRHAEIVFKEGAYHIRQLARGRAVHVNGRPTREARLTNRDVLRIGSNVFQFFEKAR